MLDFHNATVRKVPFPHFVRPRVVQAQAASDLLRWLECYAPWEFVRTHFYQQHECNLLAQSLPAQVAIFTSAETCASVTEAVGSLLGGRVRVLDVTAHKLSAGHAMGVHNDLLPRKTESHRLLLQLNRGWSEENGGLLLAHDSESPESVRYLYKPAHGSAVAFEISERSFHSVSKIYRGERYTVVYTLARAENAAG